jgi:hypothetical protein
LLVQLSNAVCTAITFVFSFSIVEPECWDRWGTFARFYSVAPSPVDVLISVRTLKMYLTQAIAQTLQISLELLFLSLLISILIFRKILIKPCTK